MAVGFPVKADYATGDVLTAANMNDFAGTLNTVPGSYGFTAGKNKIINGDFGIWQRGTSFSNPAALSYLADRWMLNYNGTGATRTISRQTFTPGSAPVSGYEGQFFFRYAQTVAGSGTTFSQVEQRIEDIRTFAGQTVTLSFWARVASGTASLGSLLFYNYGSGGSADSNSGVIATSTITTAWQRFTLTTTVASVSGKTIGANSWLGVYFQVPQNAVFTLDLWGVQLEASSVATAFQTATGTIQGELAAAQRYYYRNANTTNGYGRLSAGIGLSTTLATLATTLPVTMRVQPTSIDFSTLRLNDSATATTVTALVINSDFSQANACGLTATVASGLTQYRPYFIEQNNSTTGYIGFSAEL
jgi:hypothetical protein